MSLRFWFTCWLRRLFRRPGKPYGRTPHPAAPTPTGSPYAHAGRGGTCPRDRRNRELCGPHLPCPHRRFRRGSAVPTYWTAQHPCPASPYAPYFASRTPLNRLVGYGAMLMESFVAIMALIAVSPNCASRTALVSTAFESLSRLSVRRHSGHAHNQRPNYVAPPHVTLTCGFLRYGDTNTSPPTAWKWCR
uniref:carbon starvation CstA family protein n=1 Tax=Streptomyces asoensis TaxID=249586 RepID=UPI00263F9610|nr:carbon starvation CstA family protein [Streptomyces asoensis]